MKHTLKIASLLLQYPSVELKAEAQELQKLLAQDAVFSDEDLTRLNPLFSRLATDDIFDAQEVYVLLFDRSRSISLNLFEHIHGESRDRGGAMVHLLETYREAGLEFDSPDLPDYLPAFLEYLTLVPEAEARQYLAEIAHILWALDERLTRRESDYAPIFAALAKLAGITPDALALEELQGEPDDDPTDLEALDAVWQEAEITFGPNPEAGCPASREMLARMIVPKDQPLGATPCPSKS